MAAQEARLRYTTAASKELRGASDCQFSLLPIQELARTAGVWFDACSEAMMRGNYGELDALIREEARVAAEQGFKLTDIVQLLRILRQVAIDEEGWREDLFAELDIVIDESLTELRGSVPWDIPNGLNYLTGKGLAERERERLAGEADKEKTDRRRFARNKLHLPIRVRAFLPRGAVDEITRTENVARGGIYFLSENPYHKGVRVHVMYPYWDKPGAINPDYQAEVVRIDERDEDYKGIALKFLVDLGKQQKPIR